jgi:hypothetical protein
MKQTTLFGSFVDSNAPPNVQKSPRHRPRTSNLQQNRRANQKNLVSDDGNDDSDSDSEGVEAIRFEESAVETIAVSTSEDDSDAKGEDNMVSRRRIQQRRTRSIIVAESDEASGDGTKEPTVRQRRRTSTRNTQTSLKRIRDSDGSDDANELGLSHPKKLIKGVRPPTPDIDLLDEVDEDSGSHVLYQLTWILLR